MCKYYKLFKETFNDISTHTSRYKIFEHFVIMTAISLHNAVNKDENLEQEYINISKLYSLDDMDKFSKLISYLIVILNIKPCDVLGYLYMYLDISNKNIGQFFSPDCISSLTTRIAYKDYKDFKRSYITVHEPTAGSGGMIMEFANLMFNDGYILPTSLWVQCIEIDSLSAYMCYVQLSLWDIPAQIIFGDTLLKNNRQIIYTPAHYIYNWQERLKSHQVVIFNQPPAANDLGPKIINNIPEYSNLQYDFKF